MPFSSPASSVSSAAVLIAAASGRALAASARRAGLVPLVTDYFADEDLIALAPHHVRMAGGLARGMDGDELLAAFDTLAAAQAPQGVICGTGFEDRPGLLARIAARWLLLGNGANVVKEVKDPCAMSRLCEAACIPHPETSLVRPVDPTGWLAKRRGGSGGLHIRPASDAVDSERMYFQRHVPGMPVSALFLADGGRALVIGFSRQWASPAPGQPFRYGGAVRPADLPPGMEDALAAAVARFVAAVPLRGLNSADFLVDSDRFCMLEINPRPGATMDIFEPAHGSLLALHTGACVGRLERPAQPSGAAAAAIVYARHEIPSLPHLEWPDWTSDRPRGGTAVETGAPICTVHAAASTMAEAKGLIRERQARVHEKVNGRAA